MHVSAGVGPVLQSRTLCGALEEGIERKLGAKKFSGVIIHHNSNSVIYTQEYILDNPLGKHIGNRLVPKCFTGFQFRCRLRVTALCLAYWQMIQCFGSVLLGYCCILNRSQGDEFV